MGRACWTPWQAIEGFCICTLQGGAANPHGAPQPDGWVRPDCECQGHHGDQQSGHAGPCPAAAWSAGPKDRVPLARPTTKAPGVPGLLTNTMHIVLCISMQSVPALTKCPCKLCLKDRHSLPNFKCCSFSLDLALCRSFKSSMTQLVPIFDRAVDRVLVAPAFKPIKPWLPRDCASFFFLTGLCMLLA